MVAFLLAAMHVEMKYDADTYWYILRTHLDPKAWEISVVNGYLVAHAEETIPLKGGEEHVHQHEYKTKLSRQIDPASAFEVRACPSLATSLQISACARHTLRQRSACRLQPVPRL